MASTGDGFMSSAMSMVEMPKELPMTRDLFCDGVFASLSASATSMKNHASRIEMAICR